MNKDQFAYLNMENNDLRAELERLKGKTGCCTQCEQYAKELGLVKAELRNSNKGAEINAKVNAMFATQLREAAKKYSALRSHADKMAEALKGIKDCVHKYDCPDEGLCLCGDRIIDEALAAYRAFTKGDGK